MVWWWFTGSTDSQSSNTNNGMLSITARQPQPTSVPVTGDEQEPIVNTEPWNRRPAYETYHAATVRHEYPNLVSIQPLSAIVPPSHNNTQQSSSSPSPSPSPNLNPGPDSPQYGADADADGGISTESGVDGLNTNINTDNCEINTSSRNYDFAINYCTQPDNVVRVVVSVPELGAWNVADAPILEHKEGQGICCRSIQLPLCSIEFKYVVSDSSGEPVRWEGGSNRIISSESEGQSCQYKRSEVDQWRT